MGAGQIGSQEIPNDRLIELGAGAKDSHDKRFSNKYQIPIVQRGAFALKGDSGIWVGFSILEPTKAREVYGAGNTFTFSL